ncbi:hypothetical protein ES703_79766 [subsurface metagenome]
MDEEFEDDTERERQWLKKEFGENDEFFKALKGKLTRETKKKKDNFLDELKEAYINYKKKTYKYDKYGTEEQIQNAFSNGKIFVFRGNKISRMVVSIIILILTVSWFTIFVFGFTIDFHQTFGLGLYIFLFFTFGILTFLPCFFGILIIVRKFLVIGPTGVYYRKIIKTKFFQWSNVFVAEARIITTKGGYKTPSITTAQITIILPSGEKVRFGSFDYRNKEFTRKGKRRMFLNLFLIYSETKSIHALEIKLRELKVELEKANLEYKQLIDNSEQFDDRELYEAESRFEMKGKTIMVQLRALKEEVKRL